MKKRTKKHGVLFGSGFEAAVVDGALRHALSVAHVDNGLLGGTCLNAGCIPIGPYAPILTHEAIDVVANGGTIGWIAKGLHVHPALSEVVLRTLDSLRVSH